MTAAPRPDPTPGKDPHPGPAHSPTPPSTHPAAPPRSAPQDQPRTPASAADQSPVSAQDHPAGLSSPHPTEPGPTPTPGGSIAPGQALTGNARPAPTEPGNVAADEPGQATTPGHAGPWPVVAGEPAQAAFGEGPHGGTGPSTAVADEPDRASQGEAVNGPAVAGEPRRRLHPLSPLLSGAKSITVIIAALSWQTLSQVGVERFALVVGVIAVGVVIFSVIGWLNTGYHVVGRELRIQDGLVWRRNRAIPLDRLQSVELRRPLLAQLTGLAELRLEVVGGGKTEAPLAYLSVKEASALRQRLLALAGRTPGAADAAAEPAAGVPALERPLFRVGNRDLLISQLLTPQAFLLPVGVAFVVVQFVMEGSWTFVGIASTVTAMAGVLLQPVRRVLQDWDFRLARDPDGRLAVRYGLLETRSQVVPLHRVQSIGVTWPLLWRAKKWLHMRLDIAGYDGMQSGNDKRSDRLLPVGDLAVARHLVWEVLPGVDLAALATLPPPSRARWLHPFALRSFGAGMTPEVFVARSGLLTRELTMVPYARLQSVRVVQGPLQRMLRLATVYADTAGGLSGVAHDRDLTEAWWFADQLSARARHARAQTSPAPAPAVTAPAGPVEDDVAVPPAQVREDDAYWRRPPQP